MMQESKDAKYNVEVERCRKMMWKWKDAKSDAEVEDEKAKLEGCKMQN